MAAHLNPLDYGFIANAQYNGFVIETERFVFNIKPGYMWYMECYKKPVESHRIGWYFDMTYKGIDECDFYEAIKNNLWLRELNTFVISYVRKKSIDTILLDLA